MTVAPARAPGSMLGRYQLLSHLATGGMAEIFLARAVGPEGFERFVVVKCIKPELCGDDRFVRMFLDEARISAQLHHQNIGQVFDMGQDADTGTLYFAMEYVHGKNLLVILREGVQQQRTLSLELALAILTGAAGGLHYAHDRRGPDLQPLGIVHRDVSPTNILVGYDGAVKVVDFGIAKATTRATDTRTGMLKGKLAYMSPEQCRAESTLDRRSDVFALGILAYELTTTSTLFGCESDYETMHRIVTGTYERPSVRRPGYPADLEAIVVRCLAIAPDDRYPTAAALVGDLVDFARRHQMAPSTIGLERYMAELFGAPLEPWLGLAMPPAPASASVSGQRPAVAAPAVTPVAPSVPSSHASFAPEPVRRRWLIPGLVAGAVLTAGAIALAIGGSEPSPTPVKAKPTEPAPPATAAPAPAPALPAAVEPAPSPGAAAVVDAADPPAAAPAPATSKRKGRDRHRDSARDRTTTAPEPTPPAVDSDAKLRDKSILLPPD